MWASFSVLYLSVSKCVARTLYVRVCGSSVHVFCVCSFCVYNVHKCGCGHRSVYYTYPSVSVSLESCTCGYVGIVQCTILIRQLVCRSNAVRAGMWLVCACILCVPVSSEWRVRMSACMCMRMNVYACVGTCVFMNISECIPCVCVCVCVCV